MATKPVEVVGHCRVCGSNIYFQDQWDRLYDDHQTVVHKWREAVSKLAIVQAEKEFEREKALNKVTWLQRKCWRQRGRIVQLEKRLAELEGREYHIA